MFWGMRRFDQVLGNEEVRSGLGHEGMRSGFGNGEMRSGFGKWEDAIGLWEMGRCDRVLGMGRKI
ncbi:hypothetical protein ACN4EE_21130 [Geminocystis sp. CENA526]|uniref:hypothetical protein n=1 Tax=Geminocystis sp. CENA526 TaxID=1355871 RepID=UPI003D6FCFA8